MAGTDRRKQNLYFSNSMLDEIRLVATRLDRAQIARLTDPANYLGSADAFIDRVLASAT